MKRLARREHNLIREDQDIEHRKKLSIRRLRASIEKNLLISLILVSVTLDPLFFYIPIVNNDLNCLGLDNNLRIIVIVLLTCVDGVYIILWWRRKLASSEKRYRRILSWVVAILAVLPLPQVVVYAVSWRLLTLKLLKFIVIIQLVSRVYLIVPSYIHAKEHPSGKINMWLAAAFYLLMFILASNVLGAFYYLRAIERNVDCWRKACKIRDLCGVSSLYCHHGSSNNKYLDEFCSVLPDPNSTFFDQGIYLDAFQRDIMGIHTSFLNKFFYCFWWGLQSLSSLGQNLKPGTYVWDNIFAVFIVVFGLILLALLIGNMQVYLQKETTSDVDLEQQKQERMVRLEEQERERKKEKLGKMERLHRELATWRPFYALPPDLRKAISTCEDETWLATTHIDLKSLLSNTPHELRRAIRLHFCKDLLSKVDCFEKLPLQVKKDLRQRAKEVVFQERKFIHKEGHPIYQMFYIVNGNALAFTRGIDKMMKGLRLQAHNLTYKDSVGIELLDKAIESSQPNLPLSRQTVQAMTKVEAFALSFNDFVEVFTSHGNILPSYKEDWAANVVTHAFRKKIAMKNMTSPMKHETKETNIEQKGKNDVPFQS